MHNNWYYLTCGPAFWTFSVTVLTALYATERNGKLCKVLHFLTEYFVLKLMCRRWRASPSPLLY